MKWFNKLFGGGSEKVHTFPKNLNATACPKCNVPYSSTTFSQQVRVAYPNPERGELLPINCSECSHVAVWRYQGEWEISASAPPQSQPARVLQDLRHPKPICVIVVEGYHKLTKADQVKIVRTFVESKRLSRPASDTRFWSINLSYTPTSDVDPKFLNLVIAQLKPTFPEIGPYFDTSETYFKKRAGLDMQILHESLRIVENKGEIQITISIHLLYIYPASANQ